MADCTRLMLDIIYSCQSKRTDGLILLVNFEKAFDSLSWDFINETLKSFNFGDNFIKWISNFPIQIKLENHTQRFFLSDSFPLERGCRQGGLISSYLFILCSEFLVLAIKNNKNIEGITLYQKKHKLNFYADDTSIFLRAIEQNLKNSLETL